MVCIISCKLKIIMNNRDSSSLIALLNASHTECKACLECKKGYDTKMDGRYGAVAALPCCLSDIELLEPLCPDLSMPYVCFSARSCKSSSNGFSKQSHHVQDGGCELALLLLEPCLHLNSEAWPSCGADEPKQVLKLLAAPRVDC